MRLSRFPIFFILFLLNIFILNAHAQLFLMKKKKKPLSPPSLNSNCFYKIDFNQFKTDFEKKIPNSTLLKNIGNDLNPEDFSLAQLFEIYKELQSVSLSKNDSNELNAFSLPSLKSTNFSLPLTSNQILDLRKKRIEKLNQLLQSLGKKGNAYPEKLSAQTLRKWVEEKLETEQLEKGNLLVYNKDYSHFFDPLIEGKLQCFSMSTFFAYVDQKLRPSHSEGVPLFIFSPGHIQTGFASYIEGFLSNKVELILQEQTATDGRLISLGKSDEDPKYPMHIVSQKNYLMTKIFAPYNLEGYTQNQIESCILKKEVEAFHLSENYKKILQNEPNFSFSFNTSKYTPSGDLERKESPSDEDLKKSAYDDFNAIIASEEESQFEKEKKQKKMRAIAENKRFNQTFDRILNSEVPEEEDWIKTSKKLLISFISIKPIDFEKLQDLIYEKATLKSKNLRSVSQEQFDKLLNESEMEVLAEKKENPYFEELSSEVYKKANKYFKKNPSSFLILKAFCLNKPIYVSIQKNQLHFDCNRSLNETQIKDYFNNDFPVLFSPMRKDLQPPNTLNEILFEENKTQLFQTKQSLLQYFQVTLINTKHPQTAENLFEALKGALKNQNIFLEDLLETDLPLKSNFTKPTLIEKNEFLKTFIKLYATDSNLIQNLPKELVNENILMPLEEHEESPDENKRVLILMDSKIKRTAEHCKNLEAVAFIEKTFYFDLSCLKLLKSANEKINYLRKKLEPVDFKLTRSLLTWSDTVYIKRLLDEFKMKNKLTLTFQKPLFLSFVEILQKHQILNEKLISSESGQPLPLSEIDFLNYFLGEIQKSDLLQKNPNQNFGTLHVVPFFTDEPIQPQYDTLSKDLYFPLFLKFKKRATVSSDP